MTNEELTRINERNIEAFSLLAGQNGEICNSAEAKWAYTGTRAFNRVLTPRFEAEDSDIRISNLLDSFDRRGVKTCWIVGPSSTPSDIGARLECRGFSRIEWTGMAQDSSELPSTLDLSSSLKVIEIQDDSLFQPWSKVLCRGFGWHPSIHDDFRDVFARLGCSKGLPLRHFFGLYDGIPASACSIYEGDECRGVYLVAVDPDFRRLGLGLATTWYALNECRKNGDRLTVLQASPMGKGVYEKLNFTTHCTMGFYVPSF